MRQTVCQNNASPLFHGSVVHKVKGIGFLGPTTDEHFLDAWKAAQEAPYLSVGKQAEDTQLAETIMDEDRALLEWVATSKQVPGPTLDCHAS